MSESKILGTSFRCQNSCSTRETGSVFLSGVWLDAGFSRRVKWIYVGTYHIAWFFLIAHAYALLSPPDSPRLFFLCLITIVYASCMRSSIVPVPKQKRKRRSVFLSFHKKISQTRDFRRAERKKKGMDDPLHLAPLIAVPPSFFVRLNIWRN